VDTLLPGVAGCNLCLERLWFLPSFHLKMKISNARIFVVEAGGGILARFVEI
jgi:hypothetical protein